MGIVNNALIGASGQGGYFLTRSLRFRSSASAYLNRTPASASNRTTWTWSSWVKRGALGSYQNFIRAGGTLLRFYNTDTINIEGSGLSLITTQVFRDPSAWYHVVLAVDTTQATSSNRVKLYINGVQVTAFGTATYPSQNTALDINNNVAHYIGQNTVNAEYLDGYLTEVNFIDGQALTPSSFGSTNSVTGVWQPARYTGTYGTNGFYLPFTDNSGATATTIGKDFSGNGNNWTPNNISITSGVTYDSMTDVPTLTSATAANFAVLNPLDVTGTLTNGNQTLNSSQGASRSTIALPTTGKFYFESINTTATDTGGSISCGIGVALRTAALGSQLNGVTGMWGVQYYVERRYVWGSGGSPAYSTIMGNTAAGSVMQMCIDMDTGNAWVGLNNTWWGPTSGSTGDPSTNSNPTFTGMNAVGQLFALSMVVSNTTNTNFGQRPFAYTPPSGYASLNTFNLPTSTIVKGNTVMDVNLWAGTGATNVITNAAGFKPDFVWAKSRTNAYEHALFDSVRGANKQLASNSTAAEVTQTQGLLSFNSNGFTLGTSSDSTVNNAGSGQTYVGWQWQAGQGTTSTNTSGTITSSVSVNASAGFSVVTYTGNATIGATIGHGLGVAPQFFMIKSRSLTSDWTGYHASLGNTKAIFLNSSVAAETNPYWNNTTPTSSVISLYSYGQVNGNGATFVAYCWTPIAGYSAFGSYSGNSSADGPFVYLGFKPRWIMVKRTDTTGVWLIYDTSRIGYNQANNYLLANQSDAEGSGDNYPDILSNGFKPRVANQSINTSGGTYIYAAFAENPFKNALAR